MDANELLNDIENRISRLMNENTELKERCLNAVESWIKISKELEKEKEIWGNVDFVEVSGFEFTQARIPKETYKELLDASKKLESVRKWCEYHSIPNTAGATRKSLNELFEIMEIEK